MQRNDFYLLGFLSLIVLLIFYPLFYTDFIFTDEVVQLWWYKPGNDFTMFIMNGRAITEVLFAKLFSTIDHIHQVKWLRLFSFFGWLVCLPVWYVSFKRIMGNEPGYRWFPFFTCLYLVTSLPFAISIQWASCMELFIANTSGLLSGTVLYKSIRFTENKFRASVPAVIASVLLGFVSLFTYQSGMGCFLIPFLFHYISSYTVKKDKVFIAGLVFYFLIYALYFPLFKLVLHMNDIPHSERTSLHIDIIGKLAYFFAGPLERSFRFTIITDEHSKTATVVYAVFLLGWMALTFIRFGSMKWLLALKSIGVALIVFLLSYLPSMIVTESYASNRTLLALDMCVWLVVAETAIGYIKKKQILSVVAVLVGILFIFSGFTNFRNYFLHPIQKEYVATRDFMQQHYQKNIHTIYFIRPAEDALVKQFNIKMSMDEFGIPSSFKDWVPEDLCRQLVFEISGNRAMAQTLIIKHWPDKESFASSGVVVDSNTLVVDMPAVINSIPR